MCKHFLMNGPLLWMAVLIGAVTMPAQSQRPPQHPWMDKNLSPDRRAAMVLEQMTLDEKIGLLHGPAGPESRYRSNGGAGYVPGIPRLGIPDLQMADASYGVTRGAAKGRYSTALPSNISAASSWDLELLFEYGAAIGREIRDQGYNMSLAGGVNLMREPRNGRNFEYLGEDPILAGMLVAQFIRGVQSNGLIGDIKHYAINDQETGRNIGNVVLDKRTMRETDLLAFEIGVKEGQPGAVMCSYNKVNTDWACENSYLLSDVLKKAWGFKGWVISDWGATHSTTKAALAGLDQEMPGNTYFGDALKKAVESGDFPIVRLNEMVTRILRTEFAAGVIDNPPAPRAVDVFKGFETAERIAEKGIVLLKNSGPVLPLAAGRVKSIAVIGSHADAGVPSGGGSAQVDPPGGNAVAVQGEGRGRGAVWFPSSPLKAIRARARGAKVAYNAGDDPTSAAALARASEMAIVIVNQPMSEGRDAATLALPGNQDALVSAVAAANPRTIVVIESGGPVAMPWIGQVSAVLEAWYPGIRGGEAIASVLFGDVNPSAKLPVSFAKSDADLPYPKIQGLDLVPAPAAGQTGRRQPMPPFDINYQEGLKIGYKWFDAENKAPLFPFGHGLSYTTYAYSGLKASSDSVTFTVTNNGKRAGTEIAQVYVSLPPRANEPPRRLVAWKRVDLAPGESKTVTLKLEPLHLSIFNVEKDDWELVPGEYKVFVGASSRNTPLSASIRMGE